MTTGVSRGLSWDWRGTRECSWVAVQVTRDTRVAVTGDDSGLATVLEAEDQGDAAAGGEAGLARAADAGEQLGEGQVGQGVHPIARSRARAGWARLDVQSVEEFIAGHL